LESDASFVDALLAEVEAGLDGAGVGELLAELGESADEFGFSEARRCLARVAEKLGLGVSPVAPDSAGGPRPRVLVVDDSPENIHLLLRCLGDEYAVSVALDGETALECVRGPAPPAVVLLDVVMPGTDGYEVCRKLRADPATRDIPVLFLTALNEERDEARGLALGAMDFITKPFSPHRVKARVRNHVRLRSAMLEVERQSCELRRANEELLRSNLELKQLGQQKSEFLGIAVHDLKNPLVAIAGLAKLLLQAANPGDSGSLRPERRNEMLAAIHASAEHMGGIIKDLLQSEAIDSGRISLECREQALAPLLERAVELNRTQAARKRLDLNVSLAHGCVASLDGRRMLEVVDNLLSNAIKFSPPGKRIWVELSRLPGPPPMARISVRDEGPGLSADDMGRLFGRFAKLSARPIGGESSSGLGLSIVKRLAELHQGRVWAESEPGQGAVFLVKLPVVAD
jgi:signal transduction histidine kinase